MKVFLAGGTGLIGRAVSSALIARGDSVLVLTRDVDRARGVLDSRVELVTGDPNYAGAWQSAITGCDALINLAGQPLAAKRWDARFRQLLHDSRVDSTRFIVEEIARLDEGQRPKVLINASGVDYYGFAEIDLFDDDDIEESDPGGESFLAGLCWDWEEEAKACANVGVRVVLMRTGLVLGASGAFSKLQAPFRMRFGGRIGTGKQWMSWVHIDDVAAAYLHAIDSELAGPVNLVAPGNQRNRDFARTLGKVMGRQSWLPVPAFALKCIVGQLSNYVLRGRRTVPAALTESGFDFQFSELEPALKNLLR